MDYSKTINLPKTDFPMKADLSKREPEILSKWKKIDLYKLIRKKYTGKPKYILHDGPPYANGNIHNGHALNKILKDIVVKYKTMRGFDAPYTPGWDCHGLPVEHQLFKEMGLTKHDIPQVEFRLKAQAYANKYIDIQREEFKRLGLIGDWENPYITMSKEYEAAIIRVFKELVRKNYIYKGLKPIHWCAICETALAEAEVEYADHVSPSVYVKFPVKNQKDTFVLIWTTTPWTLPANVAVAFHPDHEYAYVKVAGQTWIMVKELVAQVMAKIKIEDYTVTKIVPGKDLEGLKLEHPFIKREVVGVLGEFVTMEDGTGVVHIAPGHGEEDYLVGIKYNLPVIAPVNNEGKFTKDVEEFAGMFVFKANQPIMERLKKNGVLLYTEEMGHPYPHCWRCKNPIVFRATEQWFMSVDKNNLRQQMLDVIKRVNWVPQVGENRISGMVELRPDWCLSRQRYWGVPLPIFYCLDCNEPILTVETVQAVEDLVRKEGADAWYLKSPEEILPKSIKCSKCGTRKFRKETDILDVWFDSGVSHEAVLKHPEIFPQLEWPADMYLEGSDQHRGWFQTSLITAVALYGKAPYQTVLTHGFVVDGEGKKMSKSLGNVIAPQEVYAKQGADILRLWVASEDYSEDVRLSNDILEHLVEAYRKIRNTCRFLLGNINDFDPPQNRINYQEMLEIDRWALHKLQELIAEVNEAYEKFQFHQVYQKIYYFCVVDMSSFYLDVLKDRLYTFKKNSPQRRSAQTVLYEILENLTLLLAPVLSFTSEEIWQFIPNKNKEESVCLVELPQTKKEYQNEQLNLRWQKIMQLRAEISKALEIARRQKLINSSLEAALEIYLPPENEYAALLKDYQPEWPMILIVSQVKITAQSKTSEDIFKSTQIEGLQIKVTKASGKKCVRCWNYAETVGQDKEHPEICHRCLPVVKELISS